MWTIKRAVRRIKGFVKIQGADRTKGSVYKDWLCARKYSMYRKRICIEITSNKGYVPINAV